MLVRVPALQSPEQQAANAGGPPQRTRGALVDHPKLAALQANSQRRHSVRSGAHLMSSG